MHGRVKWMIPADPSILEFMHSARDPYGDPAILSPSTISKNVPFGSDHIGTRLREDLQEQGLVEQTERGYYRLTPLGDSLMSGDIRPDELDG